MFEFNEIMEDDVLKKVEKYLLVAFLVISTPFIILSCVWKNLKELFSETFGQYYL